MGRAKFVIPVAELRRLYLEENWSPAKIGDRYGCNAITVRNRLMESEIPLKTKSAAHTRFLRHDFSGTDSERAYILGFRYGDLNVYQPSGRSETIVVRSHSTLSTQGDLFQSLFEPYGTVTVSCGERSTQMACYLNLSFAFLLEKYPPEIRQWLADNKELYWPFAAGYIDAEGTFGLNQGKGRFKIDAYDYEILRDLHQIFLAHGINSKFRVIAHKGENDYGWVWKNDVWRLSINEARSVEMIITKLQPYLRHAKRIADANMVLQNIRTRRLHGSIA